MTILGLDYEKVVAVHSRVLAAALCTKGYEVIFLQEEMGPRGKFYCLFQDTKELSRDIKACRNGSLEVNYAKLDEELDCIDASIDIEQQARIMGARDVLAATGN